MTDTPLLEWNPSYTLTLMESADGWRKRFFCSAGILPAFVGGWERLREEPACSLAQRWAGWKPALRRAVSAEAVRFI